MGNAFARGAGTGAVSAGLDSLGSFIRDTLTGAVLGGLGSAGFYGAGRAVEALRGVLVGIRVAETMNYFYRMNIIRK